MTMKMTERLSKDKDLGYLMQAPIITLNIFCLGVFIVFALIDPTFVSNLFAYKIVGFFIFLVTYILGALVGSKLVFMKIKEIEEAEEKGNC